MAKEEGKVEIIGQNAGRAISISIHFGEDYIFSFISKENRFP